MKFHYFWFISIFWICNGQIFIWTRSTTRVPPHQVRPRQTTRHASTSLSWGHSSFREHCHPENSHTLSNFLSTTQQFLRQLLPLQARHLQQPTSLTFTFNSASKTLDSRSQLHHLIISRFECYNNPCSSTDGYSRQNRSLITIKGIIWAVMKKSQQANLAYGDLWYLHFCYNVHGIYTQEPSSSRGWNEEIVNRV